jgi:hypothetical protein
METPNQQKPSDPAVEASEKKAVREYKPTPAQVEKQINFYKNIGLYESNEEVLKRLGDEMYKEGRDEEKKNRLMTELIYRYNLDNGALLGSTEMEIKKPGLLSLRKALIKEHQATTPSELMLIDRVVASYWRAMRYESHLRQNLENGDEEGRLRYTQLHINLIKELHRGLEHADREFITQLTFLKDSKRPRLGVNIKAENAFISDKQQIIQGDQINQKADRYGV